MFQLSLWNFVWPATELDKKLLQEYMLVSLFLPSSIEQAEQLKQITRQTRSHWQMVSPHIVSTLAKRTKSNH